jgi:hypothetical protein
MSRIWSTHEPLTHGQGAMDETSGFTRTTIRLQHMFICHEKILHYSYVLLTLLRIPQSSYRTGYRGGTVVKVLCNKSEGRWFDFRWCHWNFTLT